MSFSSDAKSEICRAQPTCQKCDIAEISAMMRAIGSLTMGANGLGLVLQTENAGTARRAFTLIKRAFALSAQVRTLRLRRFNKRYIYQVAITGEAARTILNDTMLLTDSDKGMLLSTRVPQKLLTRRCCLRAYLRGCFLASGSISAPERGYHMEFTLPNEGYAQSFARLLNKQEISAKVIFRKGSYVVYIKESEHIVALLGMIGATNALLQMENVRLEKQLRNHLNRTINCEYANLEKRLKAAQSQLEAIAMIDKLSAWRKVPLAVRQIAEARQENPEATLAELGEMIQPPASKSAVNNRMRKLLALSQQLREERGEI